MRVDLIEKNIMLEGYQTDEWESKGFTEAKTVQDFPIREKIVYLSLSCCRWCHKEDPGWNIRRDLSFLAEKNMVKPATLIRQYKKHSSGFQDWDHRDHTREWLLFAENLGPNLSIDEVSLSNGELYTLLINKTAKGRKGALLACVRGTRTADLVWVLEKLLPEELANGDTLKQLLARCWFALMKFETQIKDNNKWLRLRTVFQRYPDLEKAFEYKQQLRQILNLTDRNAAEYALSKWIQKCKQKVYKAFHSAAMSLHWNKESILNFFDNRTTNTSAELFNARIKLFRANQKGVRNTTFFLFRMSKLYA